MRVVPCSLKEAQAFAQRHHRHRSRRALGKFAVGVAKGEEMVGVAIVSRPRARHLDDGWTLEVTRLCVLEGQPNACSMLYGASWRAARAMGYTRMVTYTLDSEPGTSLLAAGWRVVAEVKARTRGWDTPSRPRVDAEPHQAKLRWEAP